MPIKSTDDVKSYSAYRVLLKKDGLRSLSSPKKFFVFAGWTFSTERRKAPLILLNPPDAVADQIRKGLGKRWTLKGLFMSSPAGSVVQLEFVNPKHAGFVRAMLRKFEKGLERWVPLPEGVEESEEVADEGDEDEAEDSPMETQPKARPLAEEKPATVAPPLPPSREKLGDLAEKKPTTGWQKTAPRPRAPLPPQRTTNVVPPQPTARVSSLFGRNPPPRPTVPPIPSPAPTSPPSGDNKRMDRKMEAENRDFIRRRQKELAVDVAVLAKTAVFAAPALKRLSADLGKAVDAGENESALALIERLGNEIDATRKTLYQRAAKEAVTARQKKLQGEFKGQLDAVKKSYFKEGAADRYGKEKLKAGKEFKDFLKELKAFEKAKAAAKGHGQRVDPTAVAKAAQRYLDHYQSDLGKKQQQHSESLRKKQICETALTAARHWQLAEDMDELGSPPWTPKQEAKAGSLHTKFLFEEDPAHPPARLTSESGVTAAWWIERADMDEAGIDQKTGRMVVDADKKTKQYIFKPIDGEENVDGIPPGGSAIREVITKNMSDALQAATGLDFGVPPTNLVAIDSHQLDVPPEWKAKERRVGSVQQFASTRGLARDFIKGNSAKLKKLPVEEAQKLAVLDFVSLNTDRHDGNVMLGERRGPNGKIPTLVPIDHGVTLPSREGLSARGAKMSPITHNVIGKLPGGDQKFTAELQEKIRLLDADEIVASMKTTIATQQAIHPDLEFDQQVGEENFQMVRRSVEFLKRAAGELTPVELADAYSVCAGEIFDADDAGKEEGFTTAIARAKKRSTAVREFSALSNLQLERLLTAVQDLGWANGLLGEEAVDWLVRHADIAHQAFASNIECPTTRRKVNDLLKKMGKTLKELGLAEETLKEQYAKTVVAYQDTSGDRSNLPSDSPADEREAADALEKIDASTLARRETAAMDELLAAARAVIQGLAKDGLRRRLEDRLKIAEVAAKQGGYATVRVTVLDQRMAVEETARLRLAMNTLPNYTSFDDRALNARFAAIFKRIGEFLDAGEWEKAREEEGAVASELDKICRELTAEVVDIGERLQAAPREAAIWKSRISGIKDRLEGHSLTPALRDLIPLRAEMQRLGL